MRMKLLRLGIMLNSEQIEDEQYPCDECEYYAIDLNYMKRQKLAQLNMEKFVLCLMFMIPILMRINRIRMIFHLK